MKIMLAHQLVLLSAVPLIVIISIRYHISLVILILYFSLFYFFLLLLFYSVSRLLEIYKIPAYKYGHYNSKPRRHPYP